MQDEPDETLAARLASDPGGVGELARRHWESAYRLAYQVVGDRQAAEDAAQDAFLRLLRGNLGYRSSQPFRPWFFRVVSNCARDRGKGERRRRAREERVARAESVPEAGVLHERERRGRIEEELAALRPEQRVALSLHYLEELSLKQVASVQGCPEGTVSSRVRRGLDRLRSRLEPSLASAGVPVGVPDRLRAAFQVDAPPIPLAIRSVAPAAVGAGAISGKTWGVGAALVLAGLVGTALWVPGGSRREAGATGPTAPVASAGTVASGLSGSPARTLSGNSSANEDADVPTSDSASGSLVGLAPTATGQEGVASSNAQVPGSEQVTVRVLHQGQPVVGIAVRFRELLTADEVRRQHTGFVAVGPDPEPIRYGAGFERRTDEVGAVHCGLSSRLWEIRVGPLPGSDHPATAALPVLAQGQEIPLQQQGVVFVFGDGEPGYKPRGSELPPCHVLDREVREVTLEIPELTAVQGRVVADADDAPIANAEVALVHGDGLTVRYEAKSGPDGRFTIPVPSWLPGGSLYVDEVGFSLPGPVSVVVDEEAEVRMVRGVPLRARVLTAAGEPAAGWHVQLGSPEGLQYTVTTDAQGRFGFDGLHPNRGRGYSLVYVSLSNLAATAEQHAFDVLAREGHEERIQLAPRHTIRGRVVAAGQPCLGAEIHALDAAGMTGWAESHDPEEVFWLNGVPQRVAERGSFELTDLAPGPALLMVISEETGTAFVSVDVPSPGEVVVELSPPAATAVEVVYADGQAVAECAVFVVPAKSDRLSSTDLLRAAQGDAERTIYDSSADFVVDLPLGFTDEQGRVEFPTELAGGVAYRVVCRPRWGRGTQVELRGGATLRVTLPEDAPPPATLLRFRPLHEGVWRPVDLVRLMTLTDPPQVFSPLEGAVRTVDFFEDNDEDEAEHSQLGWSLEPSEDPERGHQTETREVPSVGEVWVELRGHWGRAVRRVHLSPGGRVDLGDVELEPLLQVEVQVDFDLGDTSVFELELRWTDPVTGLEVTDSPTPGGSVFAPGFRALVGGPPGGGTLRPRYRSSPDGPWRELEPVVADPQGPQPLRIHVPGG